MTETKRQRLLAAIRAHYAAGAPEGLPPEAEARILDRAMERLVTATNADVLIRQMAERLGLS